MHTCNTSDTNDRHIVQINHHCSEGAPAGRRSPSFISRIFLILSCLVRGSGADNHLQISLMQCCKEEAKGEKAGGGGHQPMSQRSTVGELWPGAESTSGIPRASMQHTKNGDPGTHCQSKSEFPRPGGSRIPRATWHGSQGHR